MITDLPPSKRSAGELVARELAAVVGATLLYPFGIAGAAATPRPRRAEQRTIVLVHGYLANRSTLLPLKMYLFMRGFRSMLCFDYSSSQPIERSARALKQFCKERVRGGRIDLVCHSLGGVVARTWLQELGGARRVDRCITLSSPHRGTYGAYWVPSRVGRALRPDSTLMQRLERTRAQASRVEFTSIVAGSDNIVFPRVFADHRRRRASEEPGADHRRHRASEEPGASHEELVHVPDVGHIGMLFSPRVLRAVADRL
jgi:pimeloyl-ACP methyl ester carboxylesterase